MKAATRGYAHAVLEDAAGRQAVVTLASDLRSAVDAVAVNARLARVMTDQGTSAPARAAILSDVLSGKIDGDALAILTRAVVKEPAASVAQAWTALAGECDWIAGLVDGRDSEGVMAALAEAEESRLSRSEGLNYLSGYCDGILDRLSDTSALSEIEDQLFRFGRILASSGKLHSALADVSVPLWARRKLVHGLLEGKALPAVIRIATHSLSVKARDLAGLLEWLAEVVATARGWRVAKVVSGMELAPGARGGLSEVLASIAGKPVELQVTVDPELLGGVTVSIGDLLVDGSARHRLEMLGERLMGKEAAYRVIRSGVPGGTDH